MDFQWVIIPCFTVNGIRYNLYEYVFLICVHPTVFVMKICTTICKIHVIWGCTDSQWPVDVHY